MKNSNNYPYLRQIFFRMLLFRLFIPMTVVALIISLIAGYISEKNLENHQNQIKESICQLIEYHIDNGGRTLDAIARMAESSEKPDLSIIINSTWKSFGSFDSIYCLDKDNKITYIAPSNPRYTGLDMSNLSDLKDGIGNSNLAISRPFISLTTGNPTVYLVRPLDQGGYIIGELNLAIFQEQIQNIIKGENEDCVFIVDQVGTLIAHPSLALVKQQTNISDLGIFQKELKENTVELYSYNDSLVLGSAIRIERTGWIVVNQVSLFTFIRSHGWEFILIVLATLIIWVTLVLGLRKQIHRCVIIPLEQLTNKTNELASGDFGKDNDLSLVCTTFYEIYNLMSDFQIMSNNLKGREIELIESEKEKRETLEKALVMKDEFISLISHEFKTPLNVIYSAIQLIEGIYFDKIPHRVKELIGNIKQNTFRQLRLANNLLDVTRMNSGQFKINMQNIDIVYLIKVIAESVEPYADQKNIKISFKQNIESKVISIDDEKIERIILNLLSNAMKFTDEGGEISIDISEVTELSFIKIEITDTGIGIPKEKQEIIFERFGQVDSNLSRRAEGTGIGLSLVKLLVDILGGKIEVESELGVGSTFCLFLPINETDEENKNKEYLNIEDRVVSEIKVQFSDIYL